MKLNKKYSDKPIAINRYILILSIMGQIIKIIFIYTFLDK